MSEPLRNYEQAAEWLGVPRQWLEKKVQAGQAPHTRLGKHVRFAQRHLDAIVAAGEPTAVAPDPAPVDVAAASAPAPAVRRPGRMRGRRTAP